MENLPAYSTKAFRPAPRERALRNAPEPGRERRRAARAEAGHAFLLSLRYVAATSSLPSSAINLDAACVGSAPARPADQV